MANHLRVAENVGSRELKTRLGKYLRSVRDGNTITVTERGTPVARLSPIVLAAGEDATLQKLESAGLITLANGKAIGQHRALVLPGEAIDQTMWRERNDRL
jgi:prevent-host-death family protein